MSSLPPQRTPISKEVGLVGEAGGPKGTQTISPLALTLAKSPHVPAPGTCSFCPTYDRTKSSRLESQSPVSPLRTQARHLKS